MNRLLLLLLLCFPLYTIAQTSYKLDMGASYECVHFMEILKQVPEDVGFSIHISGDGKLTFVCNSIAWFHKLFDERGMGVSVELVSRSMYNCQKFIPKKELTRGFITKPVYRDEMLKRIDTIGDRVQVYVGTVPAHLRNEILEGNLLFVNRDNLCNGHRDVNIEQDILELLPMGLFTDTLLQQDFTSAADTGRVFMYTTMKTITIPFRKGTAALSPADVQQLKDSLKGYTIRHEEMRAYSSVDGPEAVNFKLMEQRGAAVQQAIGSLGQQVNSYRFLPVENWIEFYHDAPQFANKSKQEVKQLLQDKTTLAQVEPMLAMHRKTVVNVWLDKPTRVDTMKNEVLLPTFKKLLAAKNIAGSRQVMKEIAVRIAEERLPEDYIDQLEVPGSIEYQALISDQAVYKFYLGMLIETEALAELYKLRERQPDNPSLNYNICVLELVALKYNPAVPVNPDSLEMNIRHLLREGIHASLVTRMLVNFNIVQCERFMRVSDYAGKNKALEYIYGAFQSFALTDKARYSLAQFFAAYQRLDLAMSVIRPRLNQLNVEENIIFYYINLSFFGYDDYHSSDFTNAVLNAVNLNRARFCLFFQSVNRGGASFQLLEDEVLRKFNCDNCPD